MGSRQSSSQQRKQEGRSSHAVPRGQDRPSAVSSTVHRAKSDRSASQHREHRGRREEAHRSSRPSHRERGASSKNESSSSSRHRHSRPREERKEVRRSSSRPHSSRSEHASKGDRSRESSRDWGHASGGAERGEEDLRRILERRRQEPAKSRLSRSSSSSEEEGEMRDPKEHDVLRSPTSSSSSSRSSNVPPAQGDKGDMSDISDVSPGAPSPVTTKGSRWLSKDSGSEDGDVPSNKDAVSGKVLASKAGEPSSQPSLFSHRSIGGYGVHAEELSSESEGEADPPATKEELLKELGVLRDEEGEEGAEPSSPGTPPLPDYFPGIHGCRSVESYEWLNRIEEGTYGVVFRGRDKRTGGLWNNSNALL